MIRYAVDAQVDEQRLDQLFCAAWPGYTSRDVAPLIAASLYHVVALKEDKEVGFLRVLKCGDTRGFVMGPTVHPDAQGEGVGIGLLNEAASVGKDRGLKHLHVEFASELRGFYARAGFRHTAAGIRRL